MSPSTRQAVAPSHWVGNGFPNHAIVPGWWRKGVRLIDLVLPQDIPRHQGRNCRFGVGELSRLEPTVRPHAATALTGHRTRHTRHLPGKPQDHTPPAQPPRRDVVPACRPATQSSRQSRPAPRHQSATGVSARAHTARRLALGAAAEDQLILTIVDSQSAAAQRTATTPRMSRRAGTMDP